MVNVFIKDRAWGYEVVENDNGFITVLHTFKSLHKAMAFAAKQYQA